MDLPYGTCLVYIQIVYVSPIFMYLPYQTHCQLLHLITYVLPLDMQLHIRTVKILKFISMSGNDIVKMCNRLYMNGGGTA